MNGWCPASPDVALMDPYLFTGSGGKNWLYFSRQNLGGPRSTPTGDLYAVELTSTGMGRAGSPALVAPYADVNMLRRLHGHRLGEEPAAREPGDGAGTPRTTASDLFASFGPRSRSATEPCRSRVQDAVSRLRGERLRPWSRSPACPRLHGYRWRAIPEEREPQRQRRGVRGLRRWLPCTPGVHRQHGLHPQRRSGLPTS